MLSFFFVLIVCQALSYQLILMVCDSIFDRSSCNVTLSVDVNDGGFIGNEWVWLENIFISFDRKDISLSP